MLATTDRPLRADDSDTDDWLLVTVPLPAWSLIDAIRSIDGRSTRSTVANDLLRRSLSVAGVSR